MRLPNPPVQIRRILRTRRNSLVLFRRLGQSLEFALKPAYISVVMKHYSAYQISFQSRPCGFALLLGLLLPC